MFGLGRKFALMAQVAILVFGGAQSARSLEKVRVLIPLRGIDEAFAPFVVAKE
jgi:NitT/TauT family transport system substrate-binding protein